MNRLALATVLATLVLILAGGLVTTTGAGLAVPDWPTTFGHNMFLFPWSGMLAVSHRLVASLVLGAVLVLVMRTTGLAVRRHGADLRVEAAGAR